jgi:hypothetical protein
VTEQMIIERRERDSLEADAPIGMPPGMRVEERGCGTLERFGYTGRLEAQPHECVDRAGIRTVGRGSEDLVPEEIAGILWIGIRGILAPRFALGFEEAAAQRTRQREHRPHEGQAVGEGTARPHAGEPRDPGAAQGTMQDRLGLVIRRVPHYDVPGSVRMRHMHEEVVP